MKIKFFQYGGVNNLKQDTTTSLAGDDMDQAWNIVQNIDPRWFAKFRGDSIADVHNTGNRYQAVAPLIQQLQKLALDQNGHFNQQIFANNVKKYVPNARWNGDSLHSSSIAPLIQGYLAANASELTPEQQQAYANLGTRALQNHALITSGGNGTDPGAFGYGTATNPYVGGQITNVKKAYDIVRGGKNKGINTVVYDVDAETTGGNFGKKKIIRQGNNFYWFNDNGLTDLDKQNMANGSMGFNGDAFSERFQHYYKKAIGDQIDPRIAAQILISQGEKIPVDFYQGLGTNTQNLNRQEEKSAAKFGKHHNGGKLNKILF